MFSSVATDFGPSTKDSVVEDVWLLDISEFSGGSSRNTHFNRNELSLGSRHHGGEHNSNLGPDAEISNIIA